MATQSGEFSTHAVFEFKEDVVRQYAIAYNLMAEYNTKPTQIKQRTARLALTKLMYPLFPKMYVLRDQRAINYIAYFMRNPHKFELLELQTVFLILQRTVEKLGLTRFEQFNLPKHKAYLENDN